MCNKLYPKLPHWINWNLIWTYPCKRSVRHMSYCTVDSEEPPRGKKKMPERIALPTMTQAPTAGGILFTFKINQKEKRSKVPSGQSSPLDAGPVGKWLSAEPHYSCDFGGNVSPVAWWQPSWSWTDRHHWIPRHSPDRTLDTEAHERQRREHQPCGMMSLRTHMSRLGHLDHRPGEGGNLLISTTWEVSSEQSRNGPLTIWSLS